MFPIRNIVDQFEDGAPFKVHVEAYLLHVQDTFECACDSCSVFALAQQHRAGNTLHEPSDSTSHTVTLQWMELQQVLFSQLALCMHCDGKI